MAEPVRVYGTGSSFDAAKLAAFREAVQYVCKNTVYTMREARNDSVVKDNIKIANGCNIDQYRLIDSKTSDGRITLIYDVWITDTNLSNGLRSQHNNPKQFDGRLHLDQLQSHQDSIDSQMSLVDQVFSHYPEHAFNIMQGKYSIYINNVGKPVFQIPYIVTWNKNFLDSVHSLLENTGRKGNVLKENVSNVVIMPETDTMFLTALVTSKRQHFMYDESYVLDRIRANMSNGNYAFIKISFIDRLGNVLQSYCQDIKAPLYTFEYTGYGHFFSKEKDTNAFNVVLNVPMENIYEFIINPARSRECDN